MWPMWGLRCNVQGVCPTMLHTTTYVAMLGESEGAHVNSNVKEQVHF
jgi:hypothetical protein